MTTKWLFFAPVLIEADRLADAEAVAAPLGIPGYGAFLSTVMPEEPDITKVHQLLQEVELTAYGLPGRQPVDYDAALRRMTPRLQEIALVTLAEQQFDHDTRHGPYQVYDEGDSPPVAGGLAIQGAYSRDLYTLRIGDPCQECGERPSVRMADRPVCAPCWNEYHAIGDAVSPYLLGPGVNCAGCGEEAEYFADGGEPWCALHIDPSAWSPAQCYAWLRARHFADPQGELPAVQGIKRGNVQAVLAAWRDAVREAQELALDDGARELAEQDALDADAMHAERSA